MFSFDKRKTNLLQSHVVFSRSLTPSVKYDIYTKVAQTLRRIYQSAYMPVGLEKSSGDVVKRDFEDVLYYTSRNRKNIIKNKHLLDRFNLEKMYHFSILCRCFLTCENIEEVSKSPCRCKFPIPVRAFYCDQRFERCRKILFSEDEREAGEHLLRSTYINLTTNIS